MTRQLLGYTSTDAEGSRPPAIGPMLETFGGGMLRRNRALTELLQLARRVIADGVVTDHEATTFKYWLETNPDMAGVWPDDTLTRRLRAIFGSGELSADDRVELLKLLEDVTGEGSGARPEEWGKLDHPKN